MGQADDVRATIFVRGRVQGVGFRWWTRARARELGLVGYARNLDDGRVEVSAQGRRDDVEELARLLSEQPTTTGRPGRVQGCLTQWRAPLAGVEGFAER